MPSIKQDSFGNLADGREAKVYTLRNVDGNELKVTDYGARIVSMRFRNNNFENKFLLKSYPDISGYEKDTTTNIIYVDDDVNGFDKTFWNVEKVIEGLKLTAEVDGKSVEIIYSISNDDEISIKYKATGVNDVSAQLVFSAEVLPSPDISVYNEEKTKGKIEGKNTYNIIDEPAIVEMEVGMFGYDPGCPIDWIDAGLKNAADIVSEEAAISMNIYATQNKIQVEALEGGFAIKTNDTKKYDEGVIKGQTVYFLKNKD